MIQACIGLSHADINYKLEGMLAAMQLLLKITCIKHSLADWLHLWPRSQSPLAWQKCLSNAFIDEPWDVITAFFQIIMLWSAYKPWKDMHSKERKSSMIRNSLPSTLVLAAPCFRLLSVITSTSLDAVIAGFSSVCCGYPSSPRPLVSSDFLLFSDSLLSVRTSCKSSESCLSPGCFAAYLLPGAQYSSKQSTDKLNTTPKPAIHMTVSLSYKTFSSVAYTSEKVSVMPLCKQHFSMSLASPAHDMRYVKIVVWSHCQSPGMTLVLARRLRADSNLASWYGRLRTKREGQTVTLGRHDQARAHSKVADFLTTESVNHVSKEENGLLSNEAEEFVLFQHTAHQAHQKKHFLAAV